MLPLRPTPARLACLMLSLLVVALAAPGIAQAYRSATPAELPEVKRAVVLYHENPHNYVPGTHVSADGTHMSVTNVRVSTAAPWALASVKLTLEASGQPFAGLEILRRISGTWTDVGPVNQEPGSMVPRAVAKDLGVSYVGSSEGDTSTSASGSSGVRHSAFFEVAALVSWLIGLLAFLSAWLRRPSHFKSIGRSKSAWMAITTLGLIPLVGFIPALVYFWRVYLHLPAKHPEDQTRSRPKPVPHADTRPAAHLDAVECPICRGRRSYLCRACGGRFPSVTHCSCTNGWVSCERCNATGVIRVSRRY